MRETGGGPHLLLYDGVCGLCHRLVQFVLNRDVQNKIRLASIQSPLGRRILLGRGKNPDDLDTIYVISDYAGKSERVLSKSRAVLFILSEMGGLWKIWGGLNLLPLLILNFVYDLVASSRYQIFGKFDHCLMPDPAHKDKFLD